MERSLRIGIVAGEASGDLLAANLIESIREQHPNVVFEGIAGPKMIAAGCESLFPMEILSVMGITEVLGKLREILSIRKQVIQHFLQNPPDVFIGVDAPDFNLTVELKLRKKGIKTVHYNSPTVWAWREGRLKKIARSTDLMLTLFPFEEEYYQKKNLPVKYVGHTLADQIDLEIDQNQAKASLELSKNKKVLALLPGSRKQELHYMTETFLTVAKQCLKQDPEIQIITNMVNEKRLQLFQELVKKHAPDLPIKIFTHRSHDVMAAADVILLASGTATLEALLLKKPMVVAYRVSPITYIIGKLMIKSKYISLPNLLSDKRLVPEYIQKEATPERLTAAVLDRLSNPEKYRVLVEEFQRIHQSLRCNASHVAASATLELIDA